MSRPVAGSIVLVDWRAGALPNEPAKLRPAVVVEQHDLFPEAYPNTIVVPMTTDENLAYPAFSERIEATPENRSPQTSWALAHHVSSVSLKRVSLTGSHVEPSQLRAIRQKISLALGGE